MKSESEEETKEKIKNQYKTLNPAKLKRQIIKLRSTSLVGQKSVVL